MIFLQVSITFFTSLELVGWVFIFLDGGVDDNYFLSESLNVRDPRATLKDIPQLSCKSGSQIGSGVKRILEVSTVIESLQ